MIINADRQITISILNWNSQDTLLRCIDSVKQQTYSAINLLVLDNASSDDSITLLKKHYPDLSLIEFEQNLGFAKAHNRVIKCTNSAYYMPLNPDVVLAPDYVAEMVKTVEQDEHIGAVAGKLLFMTKDGQKTNILYSTGHLLTRSRSPTNRGYKQLDMSQFTAVEPIFAPNGAAPLYRRAMLNDVALGDEYFCEDFFIYGEDHDLGWRSQLRGWKSFFTPRAVGYHVGYGSGGIRLPSIQVQFTRNRYLTLVRNDELVHFLADLPYILLYELVWQASWLVRSPRRVLAHWRAFFQVIKAWPYARQARQQIQKHRLVDSAYIRSFFVRQLW